MCNPTIFNAFGQIGVGISRLQQARYAAAVSEQQAKYERQLALIEAGQVAQQGERELGLLRAGIGASGFALTGTPLDLVGSTSRRVATEVAVTQDRGFARAANQIADAKAKRMAGVSAFFDTVNSAGTSLLTMVS